MAGLHLHFLDGRGALSRHREWISAALQDTFDAVCRLRAPGDVDTVILPGTRVVPAKGHVGHTLSPGIIFLTVDPASEALFANRDRSLERVFAHELHHSLRMEGPGYGTTPGEAMISEGLAGHFVLDLFGGEPEPWETSPAAEIDTHRGAAREEWSQESYDHGEWFFGTGDRPLWLGYSLGFDMVGRYLRDHPDHTALGLFHTDASVFRPYL